MTYLGHVHFQPLKGFLKINFVDGLLLCFRESKVSIEDWSWESESVHIFWTCGIDLNLHIEGYFLDYTKSIFKVNKSILKVYILLIYYTATSFIVRVRVRIIKDQKIIACPARGPKQDRKIFRQCMRKYPIQATGTLCGQGRRAMDGPRSQHSQDLKGSAPSR